MDRVVTLSISGPSEVIDSAIDAFVMHHGWVPEIPEGSRPPGYIFVDKKEFARNKIRSFIMDSVAAYNIKSASELARNQAESATNQAVMLTTLTLNIE